jgi:hypothetical protein
MQQIFIRIVIGRQAAKKPENKKDGRSHPIQLSAIQ